MFVLSVTLGETTARRIPLPAWIHGAPPFRTAVIATSLPPPFLSGGATSNPRSIFNPLTLAYLGDAVWEAHTRRLETYIEAWIAQQSQAQQGTQQRHQQEQQRGSARASGRRGGGRAGERFVNAGDGDDRRDSSDVFNGVGGSRYGGVSLPSRQARKQWSTAIFQPPPCPPLSGVVLTAEELDVLRWGRNAAVSSIPRDVPVGVYKKATAVEVLVAHLYLTDPNRCAALIAAAGLTVEECPEVIKAYCT
ncbi:hypothetical protein VOLCADRAFT_121780 [Volvox carteri f. nagariensis]|uniref:RNase III domain-containing protein n=1 Tax=Volvox carteri f. nagariensis TaxID=3068 RepID=D8UKF0_VOLCA|nr:uncharacterized protein VOLCADRAFT_121780 [Volvox carteri f. nagariensis]EFJ39802.1 hypothetical protein VOLCADRAFT_121780 [Volvox carteri f. nagariensis]|eukprot:XP_002959138.1 hypothetical protein VOLCADRAFT_121780 [Volvox carteri f. nagariensis]